MGTARRSWNPVACHNNVMVLNYMRCGGSACSHGALQWRNTGSAGETGREDEHGMAPVFSSSGGGQPVVVGINSRVT